MIVGSGEKSRLKIKYVYICSIYRVSCQVLLDGRWEEIGGGGGNEMNAMLSLPTLAFSFLLFFFLLVYLIGILYN